MYKKHLPIIPSFKQEGLEGYNYDLISDQISLTIENCFKGHDRYHTNVHSTKIYYIIEGNGIFKIKEEKIKVQQGDVIEIPPKTEFVFAGKMKLVLIMSPAFRPQDGIEGRKNDL